MIDAAKQRHANWWPEDRILSSKSGLSLTTTINISTATIAILPSSGSGRLYDQLNLSKAKVYRVEQLVIGKLQR